MVHLSAPILTRPIPDFNGSIEVDIAAEDLPSGDTRQSALFGKHTLSIVHIYVHGDTVAYNTSSIILMQAFQCTQ